MYIIFAYLLSILGLLAAFTNHHNSRPHISFRHDLLRVCIRVLTSPLAVVWSSIMIPIVFCTPARTTLPSVRPSPGSLFGVQSTYACVYLHTRLMLVTTPCSSYLFVHGCGRYLLWSSNRNVRDTSTRPVSHIISVPRSCAARRAEL
ncbi:hypothetical protein C8Q76DRAFT_3994 [Earliella scabrosa]|nr:hypothetical protein C8Q76DRAFT_3994 [Earliella scabrosa]